MKFFIYARLFGTNGKRRKLGQNVLFENLYLTWNFDDCSFIIHFHGARWPFLTALYDGFFIPGRGCDTSVCSASIALVGRIKLSFQYYYLFTAICIFWLIYASIYIQLRYSNVWIQKDLCWTIFCTTRSYIRWCRLCYGCELYWAFNGPMAYGW